MKYAIIAYWLVGCLVVGADKGLHEKRCPDDKPPAASEMLAEIAIWPAAFSWAYVHLQLPACDSKP